MSSNPYRLGVEQIRTFLPHRYPFLMADRILEIHPTGELTDRTFNHTKVGIRVVGIKNVTVNEGLFQGHFPDYPIFPGVMICETMAQIASFSVYPYFRDQMELLKGMQTILLGMDSIRFRRPVVPGDTLRVESLVKKCRGKLWQFSVEATVDGERVAEGEMLANIHLAGDAK